jgi:hypothetical protein
MGGRMGSYCFSIIREITKNSKKRKKSKKIKNTKIKNKKLNI